MKWTIKELFYPHQGPKLLGGQSVQIDGGLNVSINFLLGNRHSIQNLSSKDLLKRFQK